MCDPITAFKIITGIVAFRKLKKAITPPSVTAPDVAAPVETPAPAPEGSPEVPVLGGLDELFVGQGAKKKLKLKLRGKSALSTDASGLGIPQL